MESCSEVWRGQAVIATSIPWTEKPAATQQILCVNFGQTVYVLNVYSECDCLILVCAYFFVCFCMDYLRSSSWLLLLLAVVGYLCKVWNVFIVFKMNGQISHNYDYKSKVMPGVNDWVHYGDGYSPVVWHLFERLGFLDPYSASPPHSPFSLPPPPPPPSQLKIKKNAWPVIILVLNKKFWHNYVAKYDYI